MEQYLAFRSASSISLTYIKDMKPTKDLEPDASSENMNETVRHFFGYLAGITVFMILIPLILWDIFLLEGRFSDFRLFPYDYLRIGLSLVLFIWGMVFVVWSNVFLFTVGKGGPTNLGKVTISPPTKKLVISGPYRYTRNPMVFGANTVYLSISIYLDSWVCLLVLCWFIITIFKTVIRMEEERLLNDFGAEYEDYRKNTSIIIPLPNPKRIRKSVE